MLKRMQSNTLKLKFDPKEENVIEFFKTPEVTVSMDYDFSQVTFYSSTVFRFVDILKILCFVTIICVWISFLCGALSKNIYGIEAMFVVQFAWVTFLWLDAPFVFTFSSMIPLKYSFGYNFGYSVSKNEQNAFKNILFTEKSEITDSIFINNLGFCFLLMSLFFLLSFIFGIIYKLSKPSAIRLFRNIKDKLLNKEKKEGEKEKEKRKLIP